MTTATETQTTPTQKIDYKAGDFVHIELPIKDLTRAKQFYGEGFGWTFQDVPEMDYTLFMTPGNVVNGGFFKPSETMPDKVINYLNVESIETASKKLESLGGKLLGPIVEVPGHGRLQQLLDSEGTLIALWQSNPASNN